MTEMVRRGSKYTDEDRRRVAVEFLILGNMTKVAKNVGIPRRTLAAWKQSDWWDELYAKVRLEKNEELDANLTKLIDSSFEQAQDRVENGDYRVGKDGNLIRVPMSGRDLVIAGATVYDKQRLHRNEPTSISNRESTEGMDKLVRGFQYISRNSVWNPETSRYELRATEGECEEVE